MTQYTSPPGTVFPPHTHALERSEVVLSGRFRMTLSGKTVVLEAGDSLTLPAAV